jgi:hypothetical protein
VPPPKPVSLKDYSRRYAFNLRADILVWIPPVCLFLIFFVLSFFTWHVVPTGERLAGKSLNLWALGFTEDGSALFLAYVLLTFTALAVGVACLLLELRIVPTPPALVMLMPWKSGITLALVLLTFALISNDYLMGLFPTTYLIALGEQIAIRMHLLAVIALGLELWVQGRRARHLPPPRFSVKL